MAIENVHWTQFMDFNMHLISNIDFPEFECLRQQLLYTRTFLFCPSWTFLNVVCLSKFWSHFYLTKTKFWRGESRFKRISSCFAVSSCFPNTSPKGVSREAFTPFQFQYALKCEHHLGAARIGSQSISWSQTSGLDQRGFVNFVRKKMTKI